MAIDQKLESKFKVVLESWASIAAATLEPDADWQAEEQKARQVCSLVCYALVPCYALIPN